MNKLTLVGQIKQKSTVGTLVPKTFKKYSRDPNSKFFREEYKKAIEEDDRNFVSLVNAMVNSNRPVTIFTRKILEDIVSSDKNWECERKLNNKQYTVFINALKNMSEFFQIVHQYTRTAPMIIRIVHPKLRGMISLSPEDEHKLLRQCEEYRGNRDSTQKNTESPIVVPPPMAPAIMNELVLTVAELREKQKELLSNSSWSDNTLSGIVDGPPDRVVVINDNDEEVILSRSDLMEEDCTVLGEISPYADFLEDDPEESSGS